MNNPQEIVICEACKKEEANRFATLTRDDMPDYKAEAKLCTDCGEQFLKWQRKGKSEDFIKLNVPLCCKCMAPANHSVHHRKEIGGKEIFILNISQDECNLINHTFLVCSNLLDNMLHQVVKIDE